MDCEFSGHGTHGEEEAVWLVAVPEVLACGHHIRHDKVVRRFCNGCLSSRTRGMKQCGSGHTTPWWQNIESIVKMP